jgi:hypothetical protein
VIFTDLGRHADTVKYRCLIMQKPSDAEIKNEWRSIRLQGAARDNYTLLLIR